MQGMIRCGVLAGCLVACHTSDPATPDGPTPDGPPGATGMHVKWSSNPATWPAQIDDAITLDSAQFQFENLKVIGDAGPGDDRTTKTNFELHWDANDSPSAIDFTDAPTGVYSKVSFQMDGHLVQPSYRLHGHVTLNSISMPFQVEDREELSLSLQCDRTLAPGGSVTVTVGVSFIDALKAIDWSNVRLSNGTFDLDNADIQMPTFRDKFGKAFAIDNSGPN